MSRVGTVQRAVKTPATMQSEMAKGERPELTSLVGASAAPSQTPAASALATPRPWTDWKLGVAVVLVLAFKRMGLLTRVGEALVERDEER